MFSPVEERRKSNWLLHKRRLFKWAEVCYKCRYLLCHLFPPSLLYTVTSLLNHCEHSSSTHRIWINRKKSETSRTEDEASGPNRWHEKNPAALWQHALVRGTVWDDVADSDKLSGLHIDQRPTNTHTHTRWQDEPIREHEALTHSHWTSYEHNEDNFKA